jgi:hypothetical protein
MNNQKIVNCGAGTLANDVVTKTQLDTKADQATTYTKTEVDTALAAKKNTGTFDTKIQTASTNAAIDCSGNNRIDIKVNGANRGFFYQPTG